MNERHEAKGRISSHQEGLGTVTREMIEERAKELALIEGRPRVTREDHLAARKELLGADHPLSRMEAEEVNLESLDPSDVRTDLGHQTQNFGTDDEEEMVRDLVEHGVDEAEHEQMLEAHRLDAELVDEDEEDFEGDRRDERSA